jgi:O-antigen/teichoic acid export membrane protein
MRRPSLGRDTAWLAGSDLVAIILGLVGQVFLTRALLQTEYGLLVILLDAFATLFILIDAGLPTLLNRDGARAPSHALSAAHRIIRLQAIIAVPFIVIGLISGHLLWPDIPFGLMWICAAIMLIQIATYPYRSLLRCLGEARLEGGVKMIERITTTSLYFSLYWFEVSDVRMWAGAFLVATIIAFISATILGIKIGRSAHGKGELPPEWESDKTLLLAALPFAVTLGVLPYVTRLEKFLLAILSNNEDVGLYNVAQLAWIAGIMLPQAMRAALLPVFGEVRNDVIEWQNRFIRARHYTIILLPLGLFFGHFIVSYLLPIAFEQKYHSAVQIFDILLIGWAFTILSVPCYVGLQAGENPWRFTALLVIIVIVAGIVGWILIPNQGVVGAAWGSVCGSAAMLIVSRMMSGQGRWNDPLIDILALISALTGWFLANSSWFAMIGLLTVIPAIHSIGWLRSESKISQEE